MKRATGTILCLLGLVGACARRPPEPLAGTTPRPTHDEIHARLEREGWSGPGRLGYPLKTRLRVEGVRRERGKVGTQTLSVDTVDGKPLDETIDIWVENIAREGLPSGVRCVFEGYETGKMIGCGPLLSQKEHQFFRYFFVTTVVAPSSVKVESRRPRTNE